MRIGTKRDPVEFGRAWLHENHGPRTANMAVLTCQFLGLTGTQRITAVWLGAMLHDIGKLFVDPAVTYKLGHLTSPERHKMEQHTVLGEAYLKAVGPNPDLGSESQKLLLSIVRHHHERWDGTGYPDGLSGKSIPIWARAMAPVDVYDALTRSRLYRRPYKFTRRQALSTIAAGVGTQFDPDAHVAFLHALRLLSGARGALDLRNTTIKQ